MGYLLKIYFVFIYYLKILYSTKYIGEPVSLCSFVLDNYNDLKQKSCFLLSSDVTYATIENMLKRNIWTIAAERSTELTVKCHIRLGLDYVVFAAYAYYFMHRLGVQLQMRLNLIINFSETSYHNNGFSKSECVIGLYWFVCVSPGTKFSIDIWSILLNKQKL